MIPIILVSKSLLAIETYIKKYTVTNSILAFDVFTFAPEKKEFGIDQVREIKRLIVMQSPTKRLIIVNAFDTATTEAQNALLKTLEEKTDTNQFILVAQTTDRVLSTIHSRSHTVNLDTAKSEKQSDSNKYDVLFDSISRSKNLAYLADPLIQAVTKETVLIILDEAIVYLNKKLSSQPTAPQLIKKAFQTKSLLQSNNLNPQLTVDSFLLYFHKLSKKK